MDVGNTYDCPARKEDTGCLTGAFCLMDYIENVLEKLKEWARRLIETLLGPEAQPEPEPIPIPVNDQGRRRR
jgi:hypothetical protein